MSTDQRAFLAWVAPLLGAVAFALLGLVWAGMSQDIDHHGTRLDRHEERIQSVEQNGAVATRELEHIRTAVDRISVLVERAYDREERRRGRMDPSAAPP